MKNEDFGFIGWCHEDNHDKVWGYFYRPTAAPSKYFWEVPTHEQGWNCCIFWAARGKAMQFKADVTGYELEKLVRSKTKKHYASITYEKLTEIWPTFEEEMKLKLSFEVLAGKVK